MRVTVGPTSITARAGFQRRQKAKKGRNDPKFVHGDVPSRFDVTNKDKHPDRHFFWATLADGGCHSKNMFLELGAKVETQRDGGPKLAIGATVEDGQQITNSGQVLMSCSMKQKQDWDDYGLYGNSGQNFADQQELQMSPLRNGRRVFRGMAADSRMLHESEQYEEA